MIQIDSYKFYEVLQRCPDLFPEWVERDGRFWNQKTGEVISRGGLTSYPKVPDIQPSTLYRIQAITDKSAQISGNYARIEPYSPVLFGEDTFLEEWCQLVVFDSKDSDGSIIKCGPLEECKKYLTTNFFIFEEA